MLPLVGGCGTGDRPSIACARGKAPLTDRCTVARDGATLTLRRPDGGFRRLLITRDGRGVISADGAEPARVTPIGRDAIEVAISDDRYRLPATVAQ